jgi:fibronectin-binding autotransporter adhesin
MKNLRNNLYKPVAASAVVVSLLFASFTHADTFNWTNAASGDFLTAINWTNTAGANGVPGAADTALNNKAGSTTVISASDGVVALTTLQANAGNLSITGGSLNLTNLQVTGAGNISQSGGTITNVADSRIAASGGTWNVSGGTLNFDKIVLGANTGVVNANMLVSGNAVVNQNQTAGGLGLALWVGGNNGGSGSLLLQDNAQWVNFNSAAGAVVIGRGTATTSVGIFTIQNNAIFAYSNLVNVAQNVGGNPTAIVNLNGGTMYVNGFVKGTGTGTINVTNGAITALINNANFFQGFTGPGGTNSVNLGSGNLNFNLNGNNVGISNVLSGSGGLAVSGGGILTLANTNTYTGATVVNNSTLALTNGSIAAGASLSLANATLQMALVGTPVFPTNIVTGVLTFGGTANAINISSFVGSGSEPLRISLIKYGSFAGTLANVSLSLPFIGDPSNQLQGYLTNNTAKNTIDVVITNGNIGPAILSQPSPVSRYAGYTAKFTVSATANTYQWRDGGVPLSDGGNIFGSTTSLLTITNLSAINAGNYDVVVTNTVGSVTSIVAQLTIVVPACAYEAAIVTNTPVVAYYRFNENSDTLNNANLPAFDFAGGLDGVYGMQTLNAFYSVQGPNQTSGFPGFESDNGAVEFTHGTSFPQSVVTIPSWPINTNTVTIMAWVNPTGPETAFDGLVLNRGGGGAGLTYTGTTNGAGNFTLGYIWNNDPNTFGWDSGLVAPPNQWSLVALVITPTNATIYVANTNGLAASVHTYPHASQNLSGPITIGNDSSFLTTRGFDGSMDEAAVFNVALSQSQIMALLVDATGTSNFPPIIVSQPQPLTAVAGDNVQFAVTASGTLPLSYQWQVGTNGVYVNLTDGGRIAGSQTATLTIDNVAATDPTNFIVVVTNVSGSATSSPAALTVLASRGVITLTASDASGASSLNAAGNWSNVSAPSFVNDYLTAGFLLRTPADANAYTFQGHSLTVTTGVSGLLLKGAATSSVYTFGTSAATGLILDHGWVISGVGLQNTIAGFVTLTANSGGFDPQANNGIVIAAQIGGAGPLLLERTPGGTTGTGGTLILSTANTYTAGTIIDMGDTLQLSGSGTLGATTGPLSIINTNATGLGVLDLNGTSQTVGNLSGTGGTIQNSASSTTSTLTIGNGNNGGGNFAGAIASGGGTLVLAKVGTGVITLSGANTYTGTTLISNGTLALNGSGSIVNTPVISLGSGATFDVSGLSSTFGLGAGQAIYGSAATGTINGNLNLGSGSLVLNYNSGIPTLSAGNGVFTLNNNAVTITNLSGALAAGSYKIVSKTTGGSVAGSVGSSTVTVAGGGVTAGAQTGLNISGGELFLTVGSQTFYLTNKINGSTITLSWPGGGQLLQTTNLTTPWVTNIGAVSPFTVSPTNAQMFYRVQQ